MSSPATFSYRLPSEAEARTILKNAGTEEGKKAKRNLFKSLDWAYKGMPDDAKQRAATARPTLPKELSDAIAKNATPTDADTIIILRTLLAANPDLAHPGANRYLDLDSQQAQTVKAAIDNFKLHLDEIQQGTYDKLIDLIFPPDHGATDKPQERRTAVKITFKLAYERALALSKTNGIKIDGYITAMKARGLGSPDSIKLELQFFTDKPGDQEAIIAHESTHTILDEQYRTNDDGGYIGSNKFKTSTLAERRKNAGHFEAVIRLINNQDLKQADADPTGEVQKAKETVTESVD